MAAVETILVGLAGQPNCGKSTIFNMLTGARQHVANYPGVTVEKKVGYFSIDGRKVELVDLPGTYSMTSYSLEERVARDFLLHDHPSVVVDIVDASNLKRNLYLTLQLLEMEVPVVVDLNMMDVAANRGVEINAERLSGLLGSEVVPTVGKKNKGRDVLKAAIRKASAKRDAESEPFRLDYGPMEPAIGKISNILAQNTTLGAAYPLRWLAVKLMEDDAEAKDIVAKQAIESEHVFEVAKELRQDFGDAHEKAPEQHIAHARYKRAAEIVAGVSSRANENAGVLSDRVDRFVCHRFFGPLILVLVLIALYEIAIDFGDDMATWFWGNPVDIFGWQPGWNLSLWPEIENFVASLLPAPGFLVDPLFRSLMVWVTKGVTSILNYLPIFFLLFALIAILEDSGYMPRMAFILDRLLRRYGLHGQSILPLILGGVYVGGCAIPGVMATKAIPDEKARLATILIVPLMNCLAKVPLYLIMISAFYQDNAGMAMFFIATVTILIALPVAKVLTMTVLRKKQSAPFIMEMPPYHLPTLSGVLRRAVERVWLFIKKIVTVVVAVAVVIFALIQFPGVAAERQEHYDSLQETAVSTFYKKIGAKNPYKAVIEREGVTKLILYAEDLKTAKSGIKASSESGQAQLESVKLKFRERNNDFFRIMYPEKGDKAAQKVKKGLRGLDSDRKSLRKQYTNERFESSFLGYVGKALEPVTRLAGFDWKVNIALLSAFAAKENSAATLGAIYGINDSGESVQESISGSASGFTALSALAIMVFMALYPPCIPATVMVRLQANSTKWMLFSVAYPIVLGFGSAVLIFSGGTALGLSGTEAMYCFYGLALAATIGTAFIEDKRNKV